MSWFLYMQRAHGGLDRFARLTGHTLAWLNIAIVLLVALVVALRYGAGLHSMLLMDSAQYLHALLFLACSAWTLREDGHVRVDVLYHRFPARQRAWVNLLGTLLLLMPMMGFILWSSWPYASASWSTLEGSANSGGLPWVYVLKSLIPLMAVLMLLQGLADVLRHALTLCGHPASAEEDVT